MMIFPNGYTIRVLSPNGPVFVHCTENDSGKLVHVIINIGKAGSSIASWADGLSRMITLALASKDIHSILEELSGITYNSRTTITPSKIKVKSEVDAVFHALMIYKNLKLPKLQNDYRPPRLVPSSNW